MSADRRRTLTAFAIAVLVAWFVWTWGLTIERLLRYYTPAPYLDYWRTAQMLQSYQTFAFHVFWIQHNEHRILVQEIVFALDSLVLHGKQILPLALSFACYVVSWIALVWAFWSDRQAPGPVRLGGALVAGIVMGWQGSAVILANSFLLQWTLSEAAVILSLTFLMRLKESGRNRYLVGVSVFAVIATYSTANGLLAWPMLLAGALILSIRRAQLIALTCVGIVSIAVFFIGYQFTSRLSVMNLIRHPVYLLEFLGSYLAVPFSVVGPVWFGAALGIAAMCILAVLAVVAARLGLVTSRPAMVLFGSYLYAVMTGVLIAAGRMDPELVDIANAKYSRYIGQPLVAWAAFILLCVWLCARLKRRMAEPYVLMLVFSALILIGFSKLDGWLRDRDAEFVNIQLGALAMQNDVYDEGALLYLFPWRPATVEIWSRGLRDSHLSVFYKSYRGWLGHPVNSFGLSRQPRVPGEITYASPVAGGLELAGWVEWSQLRNSSGWLLLVSDTGQIVGIGRKLPAGFPRAVRNLRTPESLGWVGFVNSKYAAASLRAYVIAKQGLVPLEGSIAVPIYHTSE